MSQTNIINGDLYIIFQEVDGVLTSYKLDNGAEVDFYNDNIVQIVLPNFENQLGRGKLDNVPMELVNTELIDDNHVKLSIKIINDTINITLDFSSIEKFK